MTAYEDFREPFRDAIRQGLVDFPDRARWLQDVSKRGELGALYAETISGALANIEETFAAIDMADLKAAAERIWNSRQVFTLGVGVNNANARNFTYLASTGMTRFHAIPRSGSTAVDDLAWADQQDVLIAMTCRPYRSEVIDAIQVAREQGVTSSPSRTVRQPDPARRRSRLHRAGRRAAVLPLVRLDHRSARNAAELRHRGLQRRDRRAGRNLSPPPPSAWHLQGGS